LFKSWIRQWDLPALVEPINAIDAPPLSGNSSSNGLSGQFSIYYSRDKMDLIKMAQLNKSKALGNTAGSSVPIPAPGERPKTLNSRRADIIENMPKIKVVREYFTDLVARLCEYSDDEDL
jgi:hypothetical protein